MRLSDISIEYIIALVIRAGLGLIFGVLAGILGLVVTLWVKPGFYVPPMWLLVLAVAAGCTISGFLTYYKPETAWRVLVNTLLIAIAGALTGSFFGFWWGEVFYPEGVRNERLVGYGDIRTPPVMAFVTWAAVGSTLTGAIYYAFRAWRYHEV